MVTKDETLKHVLTELGKEAAHRCYFYRFKEVGVTGSQKCIRFKSQHMGKFSGEFIASLYSDGKVLCHLHATKNKGNYSIPNRTLSIQDPHFVEHMRDVLNDTGRHIIETEYKRAERTMKELQLIRKKAKRQGGKWKT